MAARADHVPVDGLYASKVPRYTLPDRPPTVYSRPATAHPAAATRGVGMGLKVEQVLVAGVYASRRPTWGWAWDSRWTGFSTPVCTRPGAPPGCCRCHSHRPRRAGR